MGIESRTLDALADTFAPGDADTAGTRALVAAALERLAPHRRKKLLLVLKLLAHPLVGLALAGRARSFVRLDRASRERALLRMKRIGPLRPAFDAFARISLFAAYAAADAAGRSAVWDRLGYPGPRDDVPPGIAPFPLAAPPLGPLAADAVVIGSGAGGGVAAALLAQTGLRVIVLEAGPGFESAAARQRETESFAELYLESGLCSSDDLSVSILAGACVGGGTAVNWSTSLRLPPAVAADWAVRIGRPSFAAELADAYDAVETRLGVTVAKSHNRNNAVIVDGSAKLGWTTRAIPRNAECHGDACGYCGFGCAYGNKRSTAATYLRDAHDAGALVFAGMRAVRVRIASATDSGAAVRGVDAVTEGRTISIDAPLVVVAAGALRTPGLLVRSGITSPHLGRHLHLHPTSALSAQFDDPIEPWHGVMQSALCDRFPGVVIEAAPAHPGLMAQALPWSGRAAHAEAMTSARYRSTLIALTRDDGEGSVGTDERCDVRYRLDDGDAQHLAAGLAGAARIAFATGAIAVSTLHADPVELRAADATPSGLDAFEGEVRRRAKAREPIALFSAHQMGTARMGAGPADGAVDAEGRVYGVEGLVVADASVFPTASGVNPMLTIMALAHRATRAIIARRAAMRTSDSPAPSRS